MFQVLPMLSPIYPAFDYQKAHQAEHTREGFLAIHGIQFKFKFKIDIYFLK